MPRDAPWRKGSCRLWGVLCLATGCGTEVAQTAVLTESPGSLDCVVTGALALPQDATFGDGTEPASALLGTGYGAGQGPGLYVTARDAFRVYLNGELVVASNAPRKAVFVPLTLLPGENAISVVVAAKVGTPAALVQLDELERSYLSDTSWKMSSAPGRGYANAGFDDSAWPAATDLGLLGTLGACEPGSAFPEASGARWIGPELNSTTTAVLRKVIRVAAVGFGATATGGGSAKPALANTWEDLVALAGDPDAPRVILLSEGVHDFRTAAREQLACPTVCTNDASKTTYAVLTSTGTCATALVPRTRNERTLEFAANKTLVGLGRGAALRGVSVELGSSQNLILRNLAIFDVNRDLIEAGDAFGFDQASDIWIDHCTAKGISDGFSDVGLGTRNVTLSWLHYDGVTPRECSGQQTQVLQISDNNLTVHHTFFDHVATHAPQVHDALARVHVFNNLLGDIPGTAVSAACGSQVLLEGNTFQRVGTPTNRGGCTDGSTPGLINAPAGSNFYGDDVGDHHGGDGMEPRDAVFKPPYAYVVDDAHTEWRNVSLRAGAGGPWARPLVFD